MDEACTRTRLLRVLRQLQREPLERAAGAGAQRALPGECCLEAEGALRGFEGATAMVQCDLEPRTPLASAAEPRAPRIAPRLRSARRGH